MTPEQLQRARALAAGASSRGAIKRLGRDLDSDPALRDAMLALARAEGLELPHDAALWPGKLLLRRVLARERGARVRSNPIHRDEGFTCGHCGRTVPPHGRTARDHCPWCLRSLHVDRVPGDRAAGCGGLLDPIEVVRSGQRWVMRYRCRVCSVERVNRVLLDGDPPDDWEAVVRLSAADP